jgi:hypothetical protein
MTTEEESLDIRVLDAAAVRVFRTDGDARVRMTLADDRSYLSVRVARAFPFSDPMRYIGFRDARDRDIGLVVDAAELDSESQAVVAEELERRYFTPKAQKVISVKEEHGAVTWELVTDRGPRRFVVRNIRENSFPIGPDRMILTDAEGNRIEFYDPVHYGQKAYEVLAKVM